MLELIERLLLEADLDSELSKLDVYGKTIDGLKDFLKHLLLDPNTGKDQCWPDLTRAHTRIVFQEKL